MAIKRCPYCKAIIDEEQKYCTNCGTQLLFPEDEFIEEEIPGEKIEEEEFEKEKEEEKEELLGEEEPKLPLEEREEEGEIKAEALKEEKIEEEGEEISVESLEPVEIKEEEKEVEEEIKEEVTEEKMELKTPESMPEQIPEEEREELHFKTKDLEEKITAPSTEEKEEIERILASLREQKEEKKAPAPAEETPSLTEIIKERVLEVESGLPPWVEKIEEKEREKSLEKKVDMFPEEELRKEETREFERPRVEKRMGRPKTVIQRELPFDQEIEERGVEWERERVPSRIRSRLMAKAFDILCIAAFWLVSLWLASRVLAVSLFQLFSASALSLLTFYLTLAAAYFFLFLFFLGETLGEWIFSREA